ncbi:MAG: hypothetical protein NTY51_00380 [Deltaproteobacteria bacterium]|nr:hypothetical protein [Deltaproteobacteria bacterium]
MENRVYKVDSRMTPPIILAMISGIVLIFLNITKSNSYLFLFILAPFLYLGLEILARKITLDSNGVTVQKFLRSTHLDWPEIENVDGVRSGAKTFLILQSINARPVLITNTIDLFTDLVNTIIQRIPRDKVSDVAREIAQSAPKKLWPIIQAWLVCLIFGAVMVGKFLE